MILYISTIFVALITIWLLRLVNINAKTKNFYENKAPVVIIGGTSGIGKSTVEILKKGGKSVLVTGRNESALSELQNSGNGLITTLKGDVNDSSFIEDLTEHINELETKPMSYVISAGYGLDLPFSELTHDAIAQYLNTNLTSLTILCRAILEIDPNAHILLISSVQAFIHRKNKSLYCIAKAGLLTLGDCLISEGYNVTVFCPSWVKTNFRSNTLTTSKKDSQGMSSEKCAGYLVQSLCLRPHRIIRSRIFALVCLCFSVKSVLF